jgi:REP element-mobilizing transposase RayT
MLDVDTLVGADSRPPLPGQFNRPPKSLGAFVAGFKSAVTKRVNQTRATPGVPLWQRNYYEHIVRDAADLARIRIYIQNNPARWTVDKFHSAVPT